MALFVKKCPFFRPKIEEDVRTLDYRHCSLNDVPGEVFNCERTLEELLVDSNQIQELPRVSMRHIEYCITWAIYLYIAVRASSYFFVDGKGDT